MTVNDPFLDRDILPTDVKPLNYDVHLKPNLETFKFHGFVKIKLSVQKACKEISLNALEIEFLKVSVELPGGSCIVPTKNEIDSKKETATFTFDNEFSKGDVIFLIIEYEGIHNDKMAGFYRSSYEDVTTKEKKYMVVTQFEPTDARKALPCWDEPALKATFDVTLSIPETLVGLSNMNDVSTTVKDGVKTIRFATTPLMSTYLLAFVVGDLGFLETKTADSQSTTVRVFAPKGLENQGKFALDVCSKILTFFSNYFEIPYPIPKMDLVAIPDFSAGAMENWGLVTYRTVYLLFDEVSGAAKSKERIAYVVGHELAHQWFGNLVSPDWWSDLWLNEGFATWAGWLATDHLFPEWDVWLQFVTNDYQRGLSLDSLITSHPIEVPCKNPHDIHQIFDAISYSKGSCVIRMLASYMGQEDFRKGVSNYLKAFKYSNATTKDLWKHLEESAKGKPIGKLMHSWTRTTGYPVVTVNKKSPTVLHVKQDRFLKFGPADETHNTTTWFIPLQILKENSNSGTADVLEEKHRQLNFESGKFFKLNYNQTGFFRTLYSESDLENVGKSLKTLSASDRVGLVADIFALAQAGFCSAILGLKFLGYFSAEDNYVVLSEIASSIGILKSIYLQNSDIYSKLKKLTIDTFGPIVSKLGWDFKDEKVEGYMVQMLRSLAISAAGNSGDQNVITEARRRFELFVKGDHSVLHPNIRGGVFSIVLLHGNQSDYDKVCQIYKETKTIDQKLIALAALGSASSEELLLKTLEFGVNPDNVRPQDVIYVIGTVAANPKGRSLAWKYVKDNWKTFYDRYYSGSMSILARIVSSTTDHLVGQEMEKDVKEFFSGKELPAISRSIEQSLEKISINTNWYLRDLESMKKWASSF